MNARDIATLFAKQYQIRYSSTNFCLKMLFHIVERGKIGAFKTDIMKDFLLNYV